MPSGTCPRCGSDVAADANFCPTCGHELSAVAGDRTERHAAVVADVGDDVVVLVVTRGASAGSRYALTGEVVSVGRHPQSEVFLDDVSVSRHHAEIRRVGADHAIRDVGSLNGTYVNGHRIEAEVSLVEGDQLQIGKFKLVVVMGSRGADA